MMTPDARSSRVRLHVEDTGGEGRPLVLIHGWPLSSASWSGQVGPLAEAGYRVVAYDRRGFGQSEKPDGGFDYDTLSDDLAGLLEDLGLDDVTLVGFSMGGGEVARYVGRHGQARLRGLVFAAAVPPYLRKGPDNPEGPLTDAKAAAKEAAFRADPEQYYDEFTRNFFSVDGELKVSEAQRRQALALCRQADPGAALGCMQAFSTTDFRADLAKVQLPTLVIHGDGDAIVPFEGSGKRTHAAIAGSELALLAGAPHGSNASHAQAFNQALLGFLARN